MTHAHSEPEIVRAIPSDKLYEVMAEQYAVELLQALMAAVAGAAQWRPEAQALLRRIANAEMPEPPPAFPHHTDVDEDML
ncbi:MAG TPA: hypothetical protein VGI78_10855 [Acetobacteraceae bacterium]|jgi:hypothetical protein